jgi:helicase
MIDSMALETIDDVKREHPTIAWACDRIREKDGIEKLFEPQAEALAHAFKGKSVVIAIPTSCGKTLVAELAIMNTLSEGLGKCVYTCPLRSIAMEKYEEFSTKYGDRVRIAMSIGDYDSSDPYLADYDLIITTYEKLDSLIRHESKFINDLRVFVVDEVHAIDSASRGPTLEIVITRIRERCKNLQLLALSATVPNGDEIAGWLGAELVSSTWRPVPLYEGVYCDGEVRFNGKGPLVVESTEKAEVTLSEDAVKKGKQAIVFVNSRRSAEATAERVGIAVKGHLKDDEKRKLEGIGEEVMGAIETPTTQCKRLAGCIRNGVSFHHAGLLSKQRRLVEHAYRDGLIKVIVCTPTLGAGVNLPNFRSICRDLMRYQGGKLYPIPVGEYKQWAGRSGRVGYDGEGEAIIVARREEEKEELWDRYVEGEPEKVYSKLAVEPILRMHVLSLIATKVANSRNALLDFFKKTFFYWQNRSTEELEGKIDRILGQLEEWHFVARKEDSLSATRMGKKVSDLYIDPQTGWKFVRALISTKEKEGMRDISYLQLISNTAEMGPLPSITVREEERFFEALSKKKECLFEKYSEWDAEFDFFIKSFKLALVLEGWIDEKHEDRIAEEFRITPGELRTKIEIAKWLIYGCGELGGLLFVKSDVVRDLKKLGVRVRYGVKEDILELVELRGIGRIRGRRLYNAGIKSVAELAAVPEEMLATVVGSGVARQIKEQLE